MSHWQDGKHVVPFEGALPRFRLVTDAQVSNRPARDIEQIDVARTVLLDAPVSLEPGPQGRVERVREQPGSIAITLRAPTRQLLFVSETYHPGWRATVDETETPVMRAYGDFMALVVPAGRHQVALHFAPESLAQGLALSRVGLAVLAVVGLFAWLRLRGPSRRST